MPIKDHRDLIAWQLADKLRQLVLKMVSSGPSANDLRFRRQAEDAAASACRNIAEGFCRFNPKEFRNYVRYAQGSLGELHDELQDGFQRRYFSNGDFGEARSLIVRTNSALAGLGRYLRSRRATRNAEAITRHESTRTEGARNQPGATRTRRT